MCAGERSLYAKCSSDIDRTISAVINLTKWIICRIRRHPIIDQAEGALMRIIGASAGLAALFGLTKKAIMELYLALSN
jgi:hypothetical protein